MKVRYCSAPPSAYTVQDPNQGVGLPTGDSSSQLSSCKTCPTIKVIPKRHAQSQRPSFWAILDFVRLAVNTDPHTGRRWFAENTRAILRAQFHYILALPPIWTTTRTPLLSQWLQQLRKWAERPHFHTLSCGRVTLKHRHCRDFYLFYFVLIYFIFCRVCMCLCCACLETRG